MKSKFIVFLKQETVLIAAGLAALVTMFFVPVSGSYLTYIDFRVLALLFCLMAVVAGLSESGFFDVLAGRLVRGLKSRRSLILILTALSFFGAMFITNDVALLTFIPFALFLLERTGQGAYKILTVVLLTLAANLGSMLTPVGNPQNLYLYSKYALETGEFLKITAPVAAASFLFLLLRIFLIPNQKLQRLRVEVTRPLFLKKTLQFGVLFVICTASVCRLLPYQAVLGIIVLYMLFFNRSLFRKVDYSLLVTFVFFFVFVGNMSNIDAVRQFLQSFIKGREAVSGILVSQLISNVPAAVLLSGFTENGKALVLGTNLGGLGTIIASLASLISFKLYKKEKDAKLGKYLLSFTLENLWLLGLLSILFLFI